ncbi:MAG: lipopolysaccharide biosynthesis protein [Bradyrhizobium sp.]|uniref:lipopolysaccharide biosynthesis protein n=1 Tax=Bradyrhizobium sp. TaxID=376 RepID=UPI00353A564D
MSGKHGAEQYFAENKAYAGLGKASLHSGMIFIAARGANIFVQLASTIVLARILSPHDFGLVAIVLALFAIAPMLIDLGTADATAQKTQITATEISTLFWLNVAIGIFLAIVFAGASGLIAQFFGEPSLAGIAMALSVTFVLTAASIQHSALMRRAMQFHRMAMIDISANLVGSIVSIALALSGCGYWSLVAKPIVTSSLSAVALWTCCRWLPGRPRLSAEAKELVGFGLGVTGFTMTDYLVKSGDRLAIGYFLGAGPLGYFQNAFLIYSNALGILTEPLHNIAVSGLSKLRDDVDGLRRAWETAISTLSFVAAGAFAVLAVIAQDFVVLLLGQKWAPAGPLLCIFAVRGIAHSLERTMGWIHVALGRADRWMRWGFYSAIVQLAALALGLPFGVTGVAVSYTIAMFCLFVPALAYSGHPIGIRNRDVLQVVGPQTIAGLLAVAVGFVVELQFLGGSSAWVRMLVSGSMCLLTYLAVCVGIFRVTAPLNLMFSTLRDLRAVWMPASSRP